MRWTAVIIFLVSLSATTQAQDQKQWDKVLSFYARGKVYPGIRKCDHMMVVKPPQKDFLILRAEGNNKIGEYDRAKNDAREAYGLFEGELRRLAALQLGISMLGVGAPDSARTWLERSLGSSKDAEAWYRLGLLEKAKKDHNAAIAYFDKVLAIEPSNALVLSERGGSYALMGDTVMAKESLDKALELEPRNAVLWNARGYFLHASSGHFAKAIADYDRAIKLDPNYSYAFNNRGWAYYKLGNRDKALKNINLAAKKSRTNPFVYRNLGVIALESGDTTRACGHFHTALSLQFTAFHGPEVRELLNANCDRGMPDPPVTPDPDNGNAPVIPETPRTNAPTRSNAP